MSVALPPHQPPSPSPTNVWLNNTNTWHPNQPDTTTNTNQPDYRYQGHTSSGAGTNVGGSGVGVGVGVGGISTPAFFGGNLNSPSRSKKQQQLVCERLHGQAERMEVRKASLKKRIEKDRTSEVQRTSVRGGSASSAAGPRQQRAIGGMSINMIPQCNLSIRSRNTLSYQTPSLHPLNMPPQSTLSTHPLNTPSQPTFSTHPPTGVGPSMLNGRRGNSSGNGSSASSGSQSQSFHEALYYSDIKWQQNRAKRLEAEIAQRAKQQALDEEKMNTFVPVLSTSKEKQRVAVARRGVVPTRYTPTATITTNITTNATSSLLRPPSPAITTISSLLYHYHHHHHHD